LKAIRASWVLGDMVLTPPWTWHDHGNGSDEPVLWMDGLDLPFDDVALEYINPHTGSPALPTIACWIQLIRSGVHTKAHRQTNSAVYHVFREEGYTIVNGERFAWKTGDFFVVPLWAWHEHANNTEEDAILFSVQDTPILHALGLYRE
jgi:gentisate 1,2-dioxygenase